MDDVWGGFHFLLVWILERAIFLFISTFYNAGKCLFIPGDVCLWVKGSPLLYLRLIDLIFRLTIRHYQRRNPCARWRSCPSTQSSKAQLRLEVQQVITAVSSAKISFIVLLNLICRVSAKIIVLTMFYVQFVFNVSLIILTNYVDLMLKVLFNFRWKQRYHWRSNLLFQS